MAKIFATMFATLGALATTLTPAKAGKRVSPRGGAGAGWLCDPSSNPSKYHAEVFILKVSACWIASVAVVIALGTYEWWGKWGYMAYCVTCASPYVLVPLFAPLEGDVVRGKGPRRGSVTVTAAASRGVHLQGEPVDRRVQLRRELLVHALLLRRFERAVHVRRAQAERRAHRAVLHDARLLHVLPRVVQLRRCAQNAPRRSRRSQPGGSRSSARWSSSWRTPPRSWRASRSAGSRTTASRTGTWRTRWEARFTGSTSWCRSPCFSPSAESPPRKRRTRRRSGKPWGSSMAVLCLLDFVRLRLGLDFVMRVR